MLLRLLLWVLTWRDVSQQLCAGVDNELRGVLSAVGRVSVSEIKQEMESISFAYWQKRPSVLSCEDMLHLSGGMKLAFSEPDAFEWPLSRSARIASEKSEELRSTCFSEDLHTDNTNEESQ
ncbi:hypothetical protein AXG93_4875s1020 [Marchantia polymorpha subsp. ruderalis]|uniref:Uncharacterized protein n=1 Tax=Marchantia polymorpha subsp. ruderalis TaxID=1480154 RepID=A0A176WP80_MARPO|nr:hypothetical protein AXG93_4875s1020 [Marchantia polymorpha subsp. ruderalis]